jgi:hypothetical protein
MPYKYNPLLGIGLDEVGTGGGGGTTPPAGSDTQIQFNDGGAFGGDAGLTYNKTTDELTVAGDINLDDGGTFSTTVQSVTPTANRTISFPDATGTVALVSGANGTIQYNDAGTLKGNSNFTVNVDWDNPSTTFTALKVNVPDTAQGASDSKLLNLQSGGTSQAFIESDGLGHFGYDSGNRVRVGFNANPPGGGARLGLFATGSGRLWLGGYSNTYLGYDGQIGISSRFFGFSATTQGTLDVLLGRDDAGILAQRNGTAAQTFRLYNTWGNNGVDFERTSITRDSSGLVIDAQKGGTGADPTNLLDVKLGGTSQCKLTAGGQLLVTPSAPAGDHVFTNNCGSNRGFLFQDNTNHCNFRISYFGTTVYGTGAGYGIGVNSGVPDVKLARDSAGVVKITDGSTGTGYLKLIPTTVGALTAAATVGAGTKAFVTDSTSTLSSHHGQAVVGGGTNFVPVFSDGTNWIVG